MKVKRVSILGCGWLGFPLAKRFVAQKINVKGSTTSPSKLEKLQRENIEPFVIQCCPNLEGADIESFFQSDILFLNIPFKRTLSDPAFYYQQIESVVRHVESSSINFLVFASSTSIYPKSVKLATEGLAFIPDNPRSKVLKQVEDMLFSNAHFQTTVLRFAGLYGETRQIGKFLSGKTGLLDGASPVNLVHLEDCVNIIEKIVDENIRGEILNICSDGHPTKKDLYTQAAQKLNIPLPIFKEGSSKITKVVDNNRLKKLLNYNFQFPNPLDLS